MKKRICGILSICIIFILTIGIMPFCVQAATGKVSLSVSSKTVNIGDTITLTVTGSADEGALIQINIICEGGVEYLGKGIPGEIFNIGTDGGSVSSTLKFKATSPGTVTFRTQKVEAYTDKGEELFYSEVSSSVTVKNAVTEDPGNSGGTTNPGGDTPVTPAKSGDNSLKSLTISPGTLSPKFKYSTTKYTATVAENVTSVAVDAQVSNEKATVESVTGNTNLKVGENTIKIVVKAENGTTATYTIIVTRSGSTGENPGNDNPTVEEPTDLTAVVDGKNYVVSETLPTETLPEEFTKVTAIYNEKEVEAYAFPYQDLRVLYLTPAEDSSASGAYYFYNSEKKEFFPYINLAVGKSYMMILPVSYYVGDVPEGFQEAEVAIGDFTVEGWRCTVETTEELIKAQKDFGFYLVYGVSKDGTPGLYQYDAIDLSIQRFNEAAYAAGQGSQKDASSYIEAYNKLLDKYNGGKFRGRLIIAILIFLLVTAIIVIINILIFGRKGRKQDKDLDYVDLDDL